MSFDPPILMIVPVVCVMLALACVAHCISQPMKRKRLEREARERECQLEALRAARVRPGGLDS